MAAHDNDLILVEHRDDCHVVRFLTETLFDPLVLDEIGKQIHDLIADVPKPRFVLALDTLEHVASATLSLLISIRSACQGKGGDAVLAGVPPQIREILEVARLDSVFRVYENPDEAIFAYDNG